MRQQPDGHWLADWLEPEPLESAPASLGWLTWHLLWWWADAAAAVEGAGRAERATVESTPSGARCAWWPGSAAETVAALHARAKAWSKLLESLSVDDLERPIAFPWPEPRPLAYLLGWVNVELMKNIAEIGVVSDLHAIR